MDTVYSKPKRKEARLFLENDLIVKISEASNNTTDYKEVKHKSLTRYNMSFEKLIGIGLGSGVWQEKSGILEVTGDSGDWCKFYNLLDKHKNQYDNE